MHVCASVEEPNPIVGSLCCRGALTNRDITWNRDYQPVKRRSTILDIPSCNGILSLLNLE